MQVKTGTSTLEIYLPTSVYVNLCITYDVTISLLAIYPRELYTYVHQNTCIRVFTAALVTVGKMFFNSPNAYEK